MIVNKHYKCVKKKKEKKSRVTRVRSTSSNGQNLCEKERFEVGLAADTDRQEQGGTDSRRGMKKKRQLWQLASDFI